MPQDLLIRFQEWSYCTVRGRTRSMAQFQRNVKNYEFVSDIFGAEQVNWILYIFVEKNEYSLIQNKSCFMCLSIFAILF